MANQRRRTINRITKKYKNFAAAVAGAAILSGAIGPGIPAAVAYASEKANTESTPVAISQKNTSNIPANYKQELDIIATAYAPGPHDNNQWGNKTYLGTQIRPGIVAVDPKVIPLGSRIYIEYPDGHGEYAIAEDTGGAIKGNRIDIAKWTVKEAENFGIQHVKVYIVS